MFYSGPVQPVSHRCHTAALWNMSTFLIDSGSRPDNASRAMIVDEDIGLISVSVLKQPIVAALNLPGFAGEVQIESVPAAIINLTAIFF